ncbi:hypothetical protein MVEN_01308800 [Mycena venus]|uniref:Uncharacterized protein n=1 Tax=Mycena venus TaxID=2733690 RepID=A0A8H6Y0C4_9AGAR|nr:hypothetical protein MVEN_01308800 [Mycena venus]
MGIAVTLHSNLNLLLHKPFLRSGPSSHPPLPASTEENDTGVCTNGALETARIADTQSRLTELVTYGTDGPTCQAPTCQALLCADPSECLFVPPCLYVLATSLTISQEPWPSMRASHDPLMHAHTCCPPQPALQRLYDSRAPSPSSHESQAPSRKNCLKSRYMQNNGLVQFLSHRPCLLYPCYPYLLPSSMDLNLPDDHTNGNNDPIIHPRDLKDYLVGPKTNILPAHGWTSTSVLFNHLEENVNKVMAKPMSSVAVVIIARDRPADRAMGADAIADAIVNVGLATKDDFTLTEKIAADPTKAIIHTRRKDESNGFTFYIFPAFPEHSWYIGTFVGLSDRLTRAEFISALFEKLISDRDVIKIIQEHHDRVPDAPDITFAVRVLLEYAEVKACQDDAIKTWKDHLTSPSFTFVIDCRGRATPFKPEAARMGRARPMECTECLGLDHYKDECPIVTSPDFRAVHLNQAELDSVTVGTTLRTIRDREVIDSDGFSLVAHRASRPRFASAGQNRRAAAGRFRRQGGF